VVYEDQHALVILHDDWACRGHAMVVAKRHVQNVSELAADEWSQLSALYARAERALLAVTQCERAIVMKLGIATPHLHLHIYPVRAAADRAAVMQIINAEVREPRDQTLVDAVRDALRESGSAA
jgi:histidine triad (HIT) family protein